MTATTGASTATTTDAAVRALLDREAIHRLVHDVGRCLDEGRYEDLRAIYTTDAVARTPGGRAEGIDALVAQATRSHGRVAGVQHLITDVLADIEGDRAEVRANLLVTFTDAGAPPAPRFQLGEVYRFTARRDAGSWALDSVTSTPIWAVGDRP